MVKDILNKEYRFCDFKERKKSVHYREVDLDRLIFEKKETLEKNNLYDGELKRRK